ncbi:glycosyltransferase [Microbacterium sp. che218]|uniref:glycosyltransferase n=1 Tax=Microbacterium sp. che218 TaxID=3140649 RepID=UPI003367AF1F
MTSHPTAETATTVRPSVVGATVTYASRARSCRATVEALLAQGVESVIIVDNGSTPDAQRELRELVAEYESRVLCHRLDRNEGSAPAFGLAIALARDSGAEYVWLLDDDNLPEPGALDSLIAEERRLWDAGTVPCAVAPVRAPSAEPDEVAETIASELSREQPEANRSFAGVEVGLFARRALERLGLRRTVPRTSGDLPYAPYGGLLMRTAATRAIGDPDADLVLYGDDLEYTSRIVAAGGRIVLTPRAVVVDPRGERWMPPGFEVLAMFRSTNDALLYYSLRNRVHRELRIGKRWSRDRVLNGALFAALCLVCMAVTRRADKARVIRTAVDDAIAGRLGRRVEF